MSINVLTRSMVIFFFFLLRVAQAPVCGSMQKLIRHLLIFLKGNKNRKFTRGGVGVHLRGSIMDEVVEWCGGPLSRLTSWPPG